MIAGYFENITIFYKIAILAGGVCLLQVILGERNYFSLKKLELFIDKHLIPHLVQGKSSKKISRLKSLYILIILFLLALAMANPRWDYEMVKAYKPSTNIIFAIDISSSMNAKERGISLLERSKQEIRDVLKQLQNTNVALIAFAYNAHLISPLTSDLDAINYYLPDIDSDVVIKQGTNFDNLINQARNIFRNYERDNNYLVIMSDGDFENSEQQRLNHIKKAKEFTKELGVKIISFGFGGNESQPIYNSDGSLMKHDDKVIFTKQDKEFLKQISDTAYYINSSFLNDDIDRLFSIIDEVNFYNSENSADNIKIWHDRFYIPLSLAMIMLLPFFIRGNATLSILVLLASSALTFIPQNLMAQNNQEHIGAIRGYLDEIAPALKIENFLLNNDQRAERDFYNNNFDAAYNNFQNDYNKAVAAFRSGDLEAARNGFDYVVQQEAKQGTNEEVISSGKHLKALYNKANSNILLENYDAAITDYELILRNFPNHNNSQNNLKIARRLKELAQMQRANEQKENSDNQEQSQQQSANNTDNYSSSQNSKEKTENKENESENNTNDKISNSEENQAKDNSENELSSQDEEQLKLKSIKKDVSTEGNIQSNKKDNVSKLFDKISDRSNGLLKNRIKYQESIQAESLDKKGESNENISRPW